MPQSKSYSVLDSRTARNEFGSVIDRVFYTKKPIVIEQYKKKRAVIIPYELFEALEHNEIALLASLHSLTEENADISDADIEHVVHEEVETVRKELHAKRQQHSRRR